MKFREHIPNSVFGAEPYEIDVADTAALLRHHKILAVVERYGKTFHRFSQTGASRDCLMAELNDGKNWWVIGYSDAPLDLPEWGRFVNPEPRMLTELRAARGGAEVWSIWSRSR